MDVVKGSDVIVSELAISKAAQDSAFEKHNGSRVKDYRRPIKYCARRDI